MIKLFIILGFLTASANTTDRESLPNLDWDCAVVEVGNNPFEEGLGSIYELDKDGNAEADSDSVVAYLKLGSKKYVKFGQVSWDQKSIGLIKRFENKSEKDVIRILISEDDSKFSVYVFPAMKIMRLYTIENNEESLVATADCSGIKSPEERK